MIQDAEQIVARQLSRTRRLAGNGTQLICLHRGETLAMLMIEIAEYIKELTLAQEMEGIAEFTAL